MRPLVINPSSHHLGLLIFLAHNCPLFVVLCCPQFDRLHFLLFYSLGFYLVSSASVAMAMLHMRPASGLTWLVTGFLAFFSLTPTSLMLCNDNYFTELLTLPPSVE